MMTWTAEMIEGDCEQRTQGRSDRYLPEGWADSYWKGLENFGPGPGEEDDTLVVRRPLKNGGEEVRTVFGKKTKRAG
jgi:hypothetical protein